MQSVPLATDSTIGGFKTGNVNQTYLYFDNDILKVSDSAIADYLSGEGYFDLPTWQDIQNTPTTLSGYGITDAKIANGTIILGSNSITPLTSFTETDPTVPSWAKAASKPTYTAAEVGALPDTTSIPSKTSDLTNDSGFITSSAIPTNVSAFNNDAGYLTQHQSLAGYTPKTTAIPYIEGPSTDANGVWTGTTTDFTAYANGLTILYVPGVAGASGGVTLNINGLGAIPCYYSNANNLTTQYSVGTPILLTYKDGHWRRADYTTSDTVNARGLQSYYERGRLYSASAPLYRYKICGYHDGKIVPIVITNQESTTQVNKVPTTISLDVQRGLVYYSGTATVNAANGTIGAQALHESYQMTTAVYTFNESVATYTDVYLQGTYDVATGMFTLDNTQTSGNYRSYYAFAPKASGDYYSDFTSGKYYWFVGAAYSTANYLQLKVENPVYYYNGTQLIPVLTRALSSYLPLSGGTVTGDLTVDQHISANSISLNEFFVGDLINEVADDLGSSGYPWGGVYANNFYGDIDWSYVQNKPTKLSDFTNDVGYVTDGYVDTEIVDYAQKKITISSSEPTSSQGQNGDLWLVI